MSSSPIPVLSDVLYYTATDPYDLHTDNRPLYQLDSNTRAVAAALVGCGYGEHTATNGGLLTPGRGCQLDLSTGQIRYPTYESTSNISASVFGLIIGATTAGLNRVIWSSNFLDLQVLGLTGIISNPLPGAFLGIQRNGTGVLTVKEAATSEDLILGKVESWPYVSIRSASSEDTFASVAPSVNHANLYGFTRLRNLLLYTDMGQTPIQFKKRTIYQADYTAGVINPMSAQLTAYQDQIQSMTSNVAYDSGLMRSKVIKETFVRFTSRSDREDVNNSTWAANSFATTLLGGVPNYELQAVGSDPNAVDYTSNTTRFKNFLIEKYYQYAKVPSTLSGGGVNPLAGKITVSATVFNPPKEDVTTFDYDPYLGGENGPIIVWDFYDYNASGWEIEKKRIISMGTSAVTLYLDNLIFPASLKAL
jgi:hypothetical protein